MSQKKMEAYKYAKKNRKELEKKRKRNKVLAWLVGILVVAVLIGACVCLVYFTKQKAAPVADTTIETTAEDGATEIEAQDINEFLDENIIEVPAEGSETEPAEIEIEADSEEGAEIEVEE